MGFMMPDMPEPAAAPPPPPPMAPAVNPAGPKKPKPKMRQPSFLGTEGGGAPGIGGGTYGAKTLLGQ